MIGVRLNMKNFQKITVLASTVLLSTVFSPKAHADSGDSNIYVYGKGVEASEEVYKYEAVKADVEDLKTQTTEETKTQPTNNIVEDTASEDQGLELEMDTSQDEKFKAVGTARNVEEKANTETVNKEAVKEESIKEETPAEASQAKTLSKEKAADSFSHEDVYKYKSLDLDKNYISNSSSSSSSSNTNHKNLKEVAKSSDGRYVLKSDGKKSYYYDNGVLMKNKDTVLNGKFYTLDANGVANVAKNKWVNVNGVKYYANQNGYTQLGLKKIGNTTYHFEQNGKLSSNKTVYAKGTYYKINNKGIASAIRDQWIDYNGSTFYVNNKGGKAQGLTTISGKTYYFNNQGMAKNIPVLYSGDRFYKVDGKGVVTLHKNKWVNYNGKEFYANENGWRSQGVTHINGKVYNLTKSGKGKNYYAYSKKDNATYYFDANGVGSIVSRGKPSKDLDLLLGWMYDGMNNNMTYSMSNLRTSASASDCSSAVFRSMIYSGFRPEGSFIGNTETLFNLGKKGEVLKEISENEIRYGDIFVAGVPGKSLGAGGHTGVILDKNTIIHSNYTDNGISVTPRKGRMGDASGYPVRYYRLVGGSSRKLYI